MQYYHINNNNYFKFADLKKHKHASLKNSSQTQIDYIGSNGLVRDVDYIYAKYVGDNWRVVTGKNTSFDRLFILCDWINNYIASAPPVIVLDDNDLFVHNGNTYHVEIRGKFSMKECYFRARDLERIIDDQIVVDINYTKTIDYLFFNVKEDNRDELFLTLDGIAIMLAESENKKVNVSLYKWIMNLVSKMSIPKQPIDKSYLDFKNKMVSLEGALSAVYLVKIGAVSNCRERFNIPEKFKDDDFVYKIGKSRDVLSEMEKLHERYKDINQICIEVFWLVDYLALTTAQAYVLKHMNDKKLSLSRYGQKKLAVIPDSKLKTIRRKLREPMASYAPEKDSSFRKLIADLKQKIRDEKIKNESLAYKNEELQAELDDRARFEYPYYW